MSPEFQSAYEEQNRRDYVASAKLGTSVSIPLNLACSVMDEQMYPNLWHVFFVARLCSCFLVALAWFFFRNPRNEFERRVFGMTWFLSPLLMIQWMIYYADDPVSFYYAGLNIVLLAVGLIAPWNYIQNLLTTIFVVVVYVAGALAMKQPAAIKYVINNTTFLMLTAVLVVAGSVANSRQRLREFSLRYELDKNRKSLEESNRKLVELDQLKSRFFANVSHELRTPLTLMLAPLETLIRKYQNTLDASGRDLLLTMQASGMRLLKLINDLLDLIRLESGRLQVKSEPVALPAFVEGLASAVRQVAVTKKIALETQLDPAVKLILGDRDKLEKILLNLLFNAFKFTPHAGRVRLSVEKQNEELVFAVSDTGVGIAEKNLPFVFDRFWQEDGSAKRQFQGVGIGLALVKELTEIQNGSATVESREGQGSTFTIRLPYRPADPAAHVPKPSPTGETATDDEWLVNLYRRAELFPAIAATRDSSATTTFSRRTQLPLVLVADDEPDMRRFLVLQLNEEYEVVEAVDGRDAFAKAQESLPDLILLDLMMPHMDGLQVCRELRANTATSAIPVILLTARADEESKFDALQMGANDFLAKPFSSVELQARVKNLIERHRYQRHLSQRNEALSTAIEQIKETEMQLVQSEKMSSLGRFSAGLMHDILNPLNYSRTGLFVLRKKIRTLPDESRADADAVLNDIEDGLKRVDNIVSDLRTFTHPGGQAAEEVDLADLFNMSLRFISNELKDKKISLNLDLVPGQKAWASRNHFILVLVNLLENAIDALAGKQFPNGTGPVIDISSRAEGDRTRLLIRDNGPGIPPQNLAKIFDPFYTTKEIGKGTGLGLSICFGIVRGFGGTISATSEPGQFTEFTVDLPATAAAAAKSTPENAEPLRL